VIVFVEQTVYFFYYVYLYRMFWRAQRSTHGNAPISTREARPDAVRWELVRLDDRHAYVPQDVKTWLHEGGQGK
jgi:hypothetical protein